MTIGYFAPTNYSNSLIYSPPPKPKTTTPTVSTIGATPPRTAIIPVAKTSVTPTTTATVLPFAGVVTTTSGGTGDAFLQSSAPTATGSVSGTGSTGGTDTSGQSDTSRLIDLIAGAFQPQDVQQPFGPQTVASSGAAVSGTTSSGTNPMALLVLAILAIVGVVWYTHRKASRRAA